MEHNNRQDHGRAKTIFKMAPPGSCHLFIPNSTRGKYICGRNDNLQQQHVYVIETDEQTHAMP